MGKAKRTHDNIRSVSDKQRGHGAEPVNGRASRGPVGAFAHPVLAAGRMGIQAGTGWHVVIRYREGHERLIEGFAAKAEAVDWLEANAGQVR